MQIEIKEYAAFLEWLKKNKKRAPKEEKSKSCVGCVHRENNYCRLRSTHCVNSKNKPYYLKPEEVREKW